jgi:hypothetical protein
MIKVYEVELAVNNLSQDSDTGFEEAAQQFVRELEAVNDLDTHAKPKRIPGTRGILAVLTGIVVIGSKLGAFAAIYVLAKDLYARYVNAELELKFKDGSTLKLKNLTQAEAEKKIAEHFMRCEQA